MNITITPGSVERSESEADQPVQFVVLKEGLAERAVEVVALTQNLSDYGNTILIKCLPFLCDL